MLGSLGSLVVSLAMDTAKFRGDVGKASRDMAKLTAEAAKVGAALGAIVVGGGKAMATLVAQSVQANVAVGQLAAVSNVTTERFSAMAAGAQAFGIQQDKLADIFKDTQDKVGDFLQTGAGPMADFFENIAPKVGVTADEFARLSGPDALQLYVSSLEKANLTQSEMVFYMEAIASDSALLLPLLRDGGAGFDKYAEAARAFGATVDQDVVQQSKAMTDNFMILELAKKGLVNTITARLLPTMNMVSESLLKSAKDTGTFTKAADVAVAGVKLLASVGAIVVGVFTVAGEALGGLLASGVALLSGNWREALSISEMNGRDIIANIKGTALSVAAIWKDAGNDVAGDAEETGGQLASPLSVARRVSKKEADAIAKEAARVNKMLRAQMDAEMARVRQGENDRVRMIRDLTGQTRAAMEEYAQSTVDDAFFNGEITGEQYDNAIRDLYKLTEVAGEAKKETDEFAQELGFSFSSAFEDALLQAGSFKDVLNGLWQDIQRIFLRRYVTQQLANALGGVDFASFLGAPTGGGRIAGGGVTPGLSYDIGEGGRERFVPNMAGQIIPNNMLREGGGSPTINIQVINNTGTPAQGRAEQTGPNSFRVILDSVRSALGSEISNGQGLMVPIAARLGANPGASLRRRTVG